MRAASLPTIVLALIVGATVGAEAAQSARDFVNAIYRTYVGRNATGISMDSARARTLLTPSLMKLIDADARAAAKRQEVPKLDSDPFVDAQDFEIKAFKVDLKELGPAKATATVTFRNAASAENKPVVLDLVKIGNRWLVDDFHGSGGSIRAYLTPKPPQ